MYYANRALRGAEERYPPMEKLTFALVTASCKLKPYFQAHTIVVLIEKSLRRAMSSLKAAERMALWAIELSQFDVQYLRRTVIKGQVITDFIVEFTNMESQWPKEPSHWSIHTDGSSNKHAGRIGVVLHSLKGDKIECMVQLDFPTTNKEAEYEALVAGLDLTKAVGATSVIVYYDSQVVTSQVNSDYECKGERMKKFMDQVRKCISKLQARFFQIPREENEQANHVAKAASAKYMPLPGKVLSFFQISPLIDDVGVQEVNSESNWATPIVSYLKDGKLPNGKEAARKLKVQAAQFVLIKDILYKRGFSRPYLRCLSPEEVDYVMREVHKGICGNHSGSRSLVHKLVRAGYYWPTMQKDAQTYVKACDKCQRFSNAIKQPTEELTPITTPWPFAQWGLDIMGPFLVAIRQLKYLVVGIDYFTKWVEAEVLATITEKTVRSFIWKNIICRYGIPRVLVFDNGKQFDNDSFKDFCSQLGIKNHYSSLAHPQANEQVEVMN
ncbi:uncharacterized protein LOC142625473 [Castanea sativa]|uniref:uncharacterized protein LOC142625473 n=1 Tax=Castanea sativa TaxID=21020 RepID=UPI003F64BBFE